MLRVEYPRYNSYVPDRFYLSLWLRDFTEENMLDRYRALLAIFPYSAAKPNMGSIRVYPLDWGEHPVLEEDFPEGADVAFVLGLASEFLHSDYAYEATAAWDIWQFQKNGGPGAWKKTTSLVRLMCYGPEFEEGRNERGHLEIDFGLDTPFRADQEVPDAEARMMTVEYLKPLQENIRKLLQFVQLVEEKLPVEKRLLWSESGEKFVDVIERSFQR